MRAALRYIDVSTNFSSSNTLQSQLSHTGPGATDDPPCSYMDECKLCPEGVYVGEIGKFLQAKNTQHRKNIRGADEHSALFCHMGDNSCNSYDFEGARMVFKS